jgi:hypothetical protein
VGLVEDEDDALGRAAEVGDEIVRGFAFKRRGRMPSLATRLESRPKGPRVVSDE